MRADQYLFLNNRVGIQETEYESILEYENDSSSIFPEQPSTIPGYNSLLTLHPLTLAPYTTE